MSPSTPVTTVPVSIGESSYNEHIDTGNGIDVDLKEEMMLMITNGVPSSSSSSTNHQHGIYKPRSHARSKSPVLKRVSFGSSKGSMVETLIYDHSEEDLLRDKFNSKDNPSESVDIENPFRPGGELSREAETIVNLIKEGKPITPTTPTKELPSEKIPNGTSSPSSLSSNQNQAQQQPPKGNLIGTGLTSGKGDSHESQVTKKNTLNNQTTVDSNGHSERNRLGSELKGSSKIGNGNSLAIIKVERTIVSPDEPPKADIVTIDKKRKCVCCIIQ